MPRKSSSPGLCHTWSSPTAKPLDLDPQTVPDSEQSDARLHPRLHRFRRSGRCLGAPVITTAPLGAAGWALSAEQGKVLF